MAVFRHKYSGKTVTVDDASPEILAYYRRQARWEESQEPPKSRTKRATIKAEHPDN